MKNDSANSNRPRAINHPEETVSVILTVFNGEAFLQETLNCLWRNRQDIHEIIVLDDQSRDGSPAILQANSSLFDRFIVHNQNQGVAATRQEGVRLATGSWIHILDQDDLVEPGFYRQARTLMTNADLLISEMEILNSIERRRYQVIDLKKRQLTVESVLLHGSPAPTQSQIMGRRELFLQHRFRPYPGSDDLDFLLRTLAGHPRTAVLFGCPVSWRWHRNNSSYHTLTDPTIIEGLLDDFTRDFPEFQPLMKPAKAGTYRYAAILCKKAGRPWLAHVLTALRLSPRSILCPAGAYLFLPETLKMFFRKKFGKRVPKALLVPSDVVSSRDRARKEPSS